MKKKIFRLIVVVIVVVIVLLVGYFRTISKPYGNRPMLWSQIGQIIISQNHGDPADVYELPSHRTKTTDSFKCYAIAGKTIFYWSNKDSALCQMTPRSEPVWYFFKQFKHHRVYSIFISKEGVVLNFFNNIGDGYKRTGVAFFDFSTKKISMLPSALEARAHYPYAGIAIFTHSGEFVIQLGQSRKTILHDITNSKVWCWDFNPKLRQIIYCYSGQTYQINNNGRKKLLPLLFGINDIFVQPDSNEIWTIKAQVMPFDFRQFIIAYDQHGRILGERLQALYPLKVHPPVMELTATQQKVLAATMKKYGNSHLRQTLRH